MGKQHNSYPDDSTLSRSTRRIKRIGRTVAVTTVAAAATLGSSPARAVAPVRAKTQGSTEAEMATSTNTLVHKDASSLAAKMIHFAETKPSSAKVEAIGTGTTGIEELSIKITEGSANQTPDSSTQRYLLVAKMPGTPTFMRRGPSLSDISHLNPNDVRQVTVSDEPTSLTLEQIQPGGGWTSFDSYVRDNKFTGIKASTRPSSHEQRLTLSDEHVIEVQYKVMMAAALIDAADPGLKPAFHTSPSADNSPLPAL